MSGMTCPGTTRKCVASERTSSYSLIDMPIGSAHVGSPHSQRNSTSPSYFVTSRIRSFTSRHKVSFLAMRSSRLAIPEDRTPLRTSSDVDDDIPVVHAHGECVDRKV